MPETAAKQPPPVHLSVRLELPGKPHKDFSYRFQQPVISLGRDPSNDIQVPLTTVSRHHARIFFEMGDYFLEDLGSTHGTHHNGRKVPHGEKRLLRDRDEVTVMSFRIQFEIAGQAAMDRQPGEKTEALARRMVQEVLSSLGGSGVDPPALRVMNGPDEGKRYELSEEAVEITLGRSPDCDIVLNDQNASRRHCLVKRNWHGFTAQDLGSKNGVLVNGKQVEGAQLIKDGDELQVGGVKLIFIDPPSRLLDQMGGLAAAPATGEEAVPEGEEEPHEVAGDGYGDEGGYEAEDYAPEPEPEDHGASLEPEVSSEVDVEPSGEAPEIPAELAKAGKTGVWELVILVLGGLFLLGAVGLVLFLVL